MYIFSNRLYLEPFCFNVGTPKYDLDCFRFAKILNFCILQKIAYGGGVYTPKQSRIGHFIFSLTDYIRTNFAFNIGLPR